MLSRFSASISSSPTLSRSLFSRSTLYALLFPFSSSRITLTSLHCPQCPDFGQTGAALQSIIDHLFSCTVSTAVKPFFASKDSSSSEGEKEDVLVDTFERLNVGGSKGLKEVLRMEISRAW
jgi:hypothetical protein